jgi:hypothetical protein
MASIFLKIAPEKYLDLSPKEREDIKGRSSSLDRGEMKLSSGGKAVIEIRDENNFSLSEVLEVWKNFYSDEVGKLDKCQFYMNSHTPVNDFKELKTAREGSVVEEFRERGLVGFRVES